MQVTLILIAINVIVHIFLFISGHTFERPDLNYAYYGLNPLFFKGAYFQILTSMFIHGGILHLLMNMAILYQFGQILERFLGWRRFLFVYILGGLLTSILSLSYVYYMYQRGNFINIVGASGAICVLFGFLAFLNAKEAKGYLMVILIISFAPMLAGVQIAWYSHIFGFFVGYALGYLRYRI